MEDFFMQCKTKTMNVSTVTFKKLQWIGFSAAVARAGATGGTLLFLFKFSALSNA